MKRVLTALILIPLVLLAVLKAPNWLFAVLTGVVAVLAYVEFLGLAERYGKPFRALSLLLMLTLFGIVIWSTLPSASAVAVLVAFVLFLGLAPFVYLCAGMPRAELATVLPGAGISYIGLSYIGFSLATLVFLRMTTAGWFFVLFTFFVVWLGDTAAYYVGRSVGQFKFSPRISPKKTWEGAAASIVASAVVGVIMVAVAPSLARLLLNAHLLNGPEYFASPNYGIAALIAVGINIAAQVGDLLESLIKRGAGVKDSGTLLPGHGGVLDRIDALLFAVPVALLLFSSLRENFLRLP